ncbi:MAG TPA: OsmC family protein, partial [Rheinheimera sp.]|nr:OsmC family protein [Rheinheimera sp.]
MEAKVKWLQNNTFIGRPASGHAVVFDGNKDDSSAPSPMEMVLMAAGACSSVDVVSILKKSRQQVV